MSTRRYAGVSAADRAAERRARLLAAGLELIGTKGLSGTTVRGVAAESGLAARYFYESFATIDDLHLAVFDEIEREAQERALGALAKTAGGGEREQVHAVLSEMVDLMLSDPRKGRVALLETVNSPVLGPKAIAASQHFAALLAATSASGDPLSPTDGLPVEVRVIAQFLIGGVGHTLGAVLLQDLPIEREALVDVLADLFLAVVPSIGPLRA
ncbi:MAG TPA: TetR family transcriptional regulator [Aeromicrobium sp.]|nr:TetR family transcriptional regulator [Aeromicrobium sp.]HKY59189.1 TetR family transcriptional regulator [Aeromicrobium sp.]